MTALLGGRNTKSSLGFAVETAQAVVKPVVSHLLTQEPCCTQVPWQ